MPSYRGLLNETHMDVLKVLWPDNRLTANIIRFRMQRSRNAIQERLKHLRKYNYVECTKNGVNSRWSLTVKGRDAVQKVLVREYTEERT